MMMAFFTITTPPPPPAAHSCLVHLKIARDDPRFLGFAI